MAQKKVMSPQIAPFATMCPSTVRCRRGDGTIALLSHSPQIGCGHLRLPLSIHRDTWVVCGLPEPTSIISTKALCDTGVVLSTLSILVCTGFQQMLLLSPRGRAGRAAWVCDALRRVSPEPRRRIWVRKTRFSSMGNTSFTEGKTALTLGNTTIKRGKSKLALGNTSISRGRSTTSLGSSTITSGKTKISLGSASFSRGSTTTSFRKAIFPKRKTL